MSADNLDVVSDSLCDMTARPSDVEDCSVQPCGTGTCMLSALSVIKKIEVVLEKQELLACCYFVAWWDIFFTVLATTKSVCCLLRQR